MEIKLTKNDRRISEQFADARTSNDSSFYKNKRGAFKREDIVCGAMAELGAFLYLHDTDTPVSYPDFTIHKKKVYGADLKEVLGDLKFHIKGQTSSSEKKYGCSFLFQSEDRLVKTPDKNDIIIMCSVDLETNKVYIRKELLALEAVWGKPKIKWLQYNKKALYLKDQL